MQQELRPHAVDALRSQRDLAGGLFARRRQPAVSAANAAATWSSRVLLPTPGSPATRISEPGTKPPPSTRSTPPIPASTRGVAPAAASVTGIGPSPRGGCVIPLLSGEIVPWAAPGRCSTPGNRGTGRAICSTRDRSRYKEDGLRRHWGTLRRAGFRPAGIDRRSRTGCTRIGKRA